MAYEFVTASNQYLQIDSAPVINEPITMACWFRITDTGQTNVLQWTGQRASIRHLHLYTADDAGTYRLFALHRQSAVAAQVLKIGTVAADTWYFGMTSISAGTTFRVSLGTTETTTATAGLCGTSDPDGYSIGRNSNSSPTGYADAIIAHAAVWSIDIIGGQIAALAAGASPLSIQPGSLVRYDPLIRDLRELVGGAQLTAYNTPTVAANPPVRWVVPAMYGVPAAGGGGGSIAPLAMHYKRLRTQ